MSGQSVADVIEPVLYEHREDALTCYDHHDTGWCCVCGTHEITIPHREHMARAIDRALSAAGIGPVQEGSGYLIAQPDGDGLDFVDCTPVIMPTIEDARKDLAEWYGDTPGAAIYRLVKEDQP